MENSQNLQLVIKKIIKEKYYSCSVIDILIKNYNFKIMSDNVLNDVRTLWLDSYYYGKIKMNMKFDYYNEAIKRCKEHIILIHTYDYNETTYEWLGYNYYMD